MTKTDPLVWFIVTHGKQRTYDTIIMARETWSYRLTNEALIEEIDGGVRVYGRWDWQFGCWDLDFENGTRRSVDIDWPVLNERGVWLEPTAIRGPASQPAHASWRFEARAAYAAFFSLIPTRVRLIASPHRQHQWGELCGINLAGRSECDGVVQLK